MNSCDSNGPASDAITGNRGETSATQTSQPNCSTSDGIIGNYRGIANETEIWPPRDICTDLLREIEELRGELDLEAAEDEPTEEGTNGVYMTMNSDNVETYYEEYMYNGDEIDYTDEEDMYSSDEDDMYTGDDDFISLYHHARRRAYYGAERNAYLSDGQSEDEDNLPVRNDMGATTSEVEEDRYNDIMDEYLHDCSDCSF